MCLTGKKNFLSVVMESKDSDYLSLSYHNMIISSTAQENIDETKPWLQQLEIALEKSI